MIIVMALMASGPIQTLCKGAYSKRAALEQPPRTNEKAERNQSQFEKRSVKVARTMFLLIYYIVVQINFRYSQTYIRQLYTRDVRI